jgi:hypothetical protein
VQNDLQEMMQNLVGIVRREEMVCVLDQLASFGNAPGNAARGHREYNSAGTAID